MFLLFILFVLFIPPAVPGNKEAFNTNKKKNQRFEVIQHFITLLLNEHKVNHTNDWKKCLQQKNHACCQRKIDATQQIKISQRSVNGILFADKPIAVNKANIGKYSAD